MTKPKMYFLRADNAGTEGQHLYLQHVAFDGTRARFGPETSQSYSFTPAQRQEFQDKYPYIKGRWVSLHTELDRLRAKESK